MKRRDFITLLGSATAWPFAASAQRKSLPVVGFLNPRSRSRGEAVASAFREGLREAGYEDGQNVAVEYRWADGQIDRLQALANDLVARGVVAIVAGGGSWVAAKAATSSIPIVFTTGLDPVRAGMVKSLNRPEANLTGATFYSGGALFEKQIDLLRALVPNVRTVAMIVHIGLTEVESQVPDAEDAARRNGVVLSVVKVADVNDLDAAFDAIQADGLLFAVDPFFDSRPAEIVAGSTRRRVPTIYYIREFVAAGGLASYGASIRDTYHTAGLYAGRILKGAKPAELPVVQPTRFELVINLKTAKTLGLAIPPGLLAVADEVIE
jgi:putative tryptophan/tyrosine transport system substrate-binding protein